ncbi:hypothetical protein BJV82DRAFT_39586 [Fennellomyces sp. T-0311]|nr:hypothetical protein BJV82DRAFT_39586 [Fennellomyces sp. T-0311]
MERHVITMSSYLEMMERLDGISHVIQRQPEAWTAPINDQNDINALQNWLEQLSANIQTDSCIYPELTSPQSSGLPTTVSDSTNLDGDLYPAFDMLRHQPETVIPDWKAMMMTYSDNPLTACLLEQNKNISFPPSIHSDQTLSTTDNGQHTIAANFWTPGKSADVDVQPIEDAVQSEAIEFDTVAMVQSKPQPIHMFESSKDEADVNSKQKKWSHNEKRNMMHMLNVFTAPGQESTTKQSKSGEIPQPTTPTGGDHVDLKPKDSEPSLSSDEQEPTDPIAKLLFSRIADETAESRLKPKQAKDNGSPSPYAELVDKLRDLTFNDTPAEERARRRHAAIVDRLWDAVLKAKQANLDKQKAGSFRKPSSSRLRDTRHTDTTARLVSV